MNREVEKKREELYQSEYKPQRSNETQKKGGNRNPNRFCLKLWFPMEQFDFKITIFLIKREWKKGSFFTANLNPKTSNEIQIEKGGKTKSKQICFKISFQNWKKNPNFSRSRNETKKKSKNLETNCEDEMEDQLRIRVKAKH